MSLARADARFLLPDPITSAAVLGDVDGWRSALERGQVEVVTGTSRPNLVVAPASDWRAAVQTGASGIVLHGRDQAARLRRAGIPARAHFPIPNGADPVALLPLDAPRIARYALTRMVAPPSSLKVLRNRLLPPLLGPGARLTGRELVTTASPGGITPRLVSAAARELGADERLDWLLVPGRGDLLARCILLLFPPEADEPHWALKFARMPDYTFPFDREERGHRLLSSTDPVVTAHAPRPLGRFELDGRHASLETAAPGATLAAYLHGTEPRERKLEMLDRIAGWLVAVAERTAEPPPALDEEVARLAGVAATWGDPAAGLDPAAALRDVPAVLVHDDLGSWNIAVDRSEFVALDWEGARRDGFPLCDLLYLLSDALAHLDGVPPDLDAREAHFVALNRGELDSSRTLFHWIGETVRRLELPPERVGAIATFAWMHHGLPTPERQAASEELDEARAPAFWNQWIWRFARRWVTDPTLGRDWSAWRGG
jgi:hypothetical protein